MMNVYKYLPYIADEWDVVALEDDAADLFAGAALLQVHLLRLVQHSVHVFIEADDLSLDAEVGVLVEPDLHPWLSLEELVDQELNALINVSI